MKPIDQPIEQPIEQRRNWAYARMFFPTLESLDAAVSALAVDDEMAPVLGDAPWFYLRFVDTLGPQLRLRLRGDATTRSRFIAASQAWYRRTRTGMEADGPDGQTFGRWGFDVGSYRPEIGKYGTEEAVRVVEDHWVSQCPVILSTWAGDVPKQRRLAVFALTADLVYEAAGSTDDQVAALRQHAWYWLRTTLPSHGSQARFVAQVARRTAAIKQSSVPPLVAELADGLSTTIDRVAVVGAPQAPAHHRFNLLHIAANRLGLSPMEEAFTLLAVAEMRRIESGLGQVAA